MTLDDSGNIYLRVHRDAGGLSRITPAGVINTLAPHSAGVLSSDDGTPLRSAGLLMNTSTRVATDHDGNLLIAESLRVRRVHSVEDCHVSLEVSAGLLYPRTTEGTPVEDEEFTLTSTDGPLSYSLCVDQYWVSLSPPVSDPSGSSDTITVSFDTEGRGPGFNFALITATTTDGSMEAPIPVQLSILPPDPQMQVSTDQLDFALTGGVNPPAQLFNVQNPGLGSLNYRIRADQPWVFGTPDVGTLFGELDPIGISVNASGLGEGVHNAIVAVEQVDGELVENIDVVLTRGYPDFR